MEIDTRLIRTAPPRTRERFATIEPTTFPAAKSMSFRTAEARETANSGRLVPKPTTIAPITANETPQRRARLLEDSTSALALKTKTAIPAKTRTNDRIISYKLPFQATLRRFQLVVLV